jgi:hypothetical protein
MTIEHHLTEILFADPVKGEDFKLYLYGKDGFHGGPIWFTSGRIRYPDEQIAAGVAQLLVEKHVRDGLEVRITNGGDFLVFHSQRGQMLFPTNADQFWSKV